MRICGVFIVFQGFGALKSAAFKTAGRYDVSAKVERRLRYGVGFSAAQRQAGHKVCQHLSGWLHRYSWISASAGQNNPNVQSA